MVILVCEIPKYRFRYHTSMSLRTIISGRKEIILDRDYMVDTVDPVVVKLMLNSRV